MGLQEKIEAIIRLDKPTLQIYTHEDLDGFDTAVLEKFSVGDLASKIEFIAVQYGKIQSIPAPTAQRVILNDFTHGFDGVHFHTDHHKGTYVASGDTALFPDAKSNAGVLARALDFNGRFSDDLLESFAHAADVIDSAGYAKEGFTAKDQRRFLIDDEPSLDPIVEPKLEHYFALNKVLMAFKTKEMGNRTFFEQCLYDAEDLHPLSLLYTALENARKLETKKGPMFDPNMSHKEILAALQTNGDKYARKFVDYKNKMQFFDLPKGQALYLEHGYFGNMSQPGSYDRYVPFEAFPNVRYLIHNWKSMGLIQIALNPACEIEDDNFYALVNEAIAEARVDFPNRYGSMRYFKSAISKDKRDDPSLHLIGPKKSLIEKLLGERSQDFERVRFNCAMREWLAQYEFDAWDLVAESSGGHKAISNISGLDVFSPVTEEGEEMSERYRIGKYFVDKIIEKLS